MSIAPLVTTAREPRLILSILEQWRGGEFEARSSPLEARALWDRRCERDRARNRNGEHGLDRDASCARRTSGDHAVRFLRRSPVRLVPDSRGRCGRWWWRRWIRHSVGRDKESNGRWRRRRRRGDRRRSIARRWDGAQDQDRTPRSRGCRWSPERPSRHQWRYRREHRRRCERWRCGECRWRASGAAGCRRGRGLLDGFGWCSWRQCRRLWGRWWVRRGSGDRDQWGGVGAPTNDGSSNGGAFLTAGGAKGSSGQSASAPKRPGDGGFGGGGGAPGGAGGSGSSGVAGVVMIQQVA